MSRERILDAACELFAGRGFDAVTMGEIATRAGVARATVFNQFGSKHALVEAITASVFDYYAAMLDQALADESSPTPALVRALFEHMGAGIEQFHGFYRDCRVISDDVPGIESEFDGAVEVYRRREELEPLIDRYLADPAARRALAERGRRIVLERHTFDHRAETLRAAADRIAATRPDRVLPPTA
jgi:AcrR family transcriptional regulator